MTTIASTFRDGIATILRGIKQEWQGWMRIIHDKRVLLIVSAIALALLVAALKPIPPRTFFIASGQPGSAYDRLSKGLAAGFAEERLSLTLVPMAGQVEGF
jgi:hypothetical protein